MVKFPYQIELESEKETTKLAEEFSKEVRKGDVVVLNGNLGAGKTFFIKKTVEVFGINFASSPSFAIINEYDGEIKIYHFDFFRLNNIEELFNIGWQDYLIDNEAIIFIEWGELLKEALPEARFDIRINMLDESKRKFEFNKYD